jgi:hypothetical protein
MSIGNWFWLFYVLSLFYGAWVDYGEGPYLPRLGRHLTYYILFGLVGYKLFGGPLSSH